MTFLKKLALFGLTAALLFAAVACGEGGGKTEPSTPGVVTPDTEAHYVEDTLHKISVTDTGRAFITDAGSAYAVVAGESAAAKVAANFIVTHLLNATGTELPLLEDAAWSQNAKYIVPLSRTDWKICAHTKRRNILLRGRSRSSLCDNCKEQRSFDHILSPALIAQSELRCFHRKQSPKRRPAIRTFPLQVSDADILSDSILRSSSLLLFGCPQSRINEASPST